MSLLQRILAVLAESPLPCPTPDLVALTDTGLSHHRSRVWAALCALQKSHLVRKSGTRKTKGHRGGNVVALWVLVP